MWSTPKLISECTPISNFSANHGGNDNDQGNENDPSNKNDQTCSVGNKFWYLYILQLVRVFLMWILNM